MKYFCEYSKAGRIAARTANGIRQTYEYDACGQLLAVKEGGADAERYVYDRAGNMVRKTVRGRTTVFSFDGANQLVSSTVDGRTTQYAYDAAGRLVREGDRTYRYGYLDKVLGVTGGGRTCAYDYHVDGQLARADYGDGRAEDFSWDGLALIRRGGECFVNEPHAGGGAPVASSRGTTYFNDLLGTTVGVREGRKAPRYSAAALTAFGEAVNSASGPSVAESSTFFTGKPHVDGLGRAFLFRNYRAPLAKWQTADPLGYPDGWNQLAYCRNAGNLYIDVLGAVAYVRHRLGSLRHGAQSARGHRLWYPARGGHELDDRALRLARAFLAAAAPQTDCPLWGEDDTRRILPRARIDVEFQNPLYTAEIAELWQR